MYTIIDPNNAKPFLKWAGGKRQLLKELDEYIPEKFNRYIEPFLGGGAVFFHLQPKNAVLGDLNEELVNCYTIVRDRVKELILELIQYKNDKKFYYELRGLNPLQLDPVQRAARIIYLNRTGFNGLYRVNKKGEFNVPFGNYQNPVICDEPVLLGASKVLQGVTILHNDYRDVLNQYAEPGDFIFLDPPYHPLEGYADFKRFTKEFFYDEDHIELRDEFSRLVKMGCWVILTNSNTKFVKDLYKEYDYKAVNTKRNISSKSSTRTGEDLIVIATKPKRKTASQIGTQNGGLLQNFPGTRFMGSKYKVLPFLWDSIKDLQFESVLDSFSGSACVSYMFKQYGKKVYSNDFMHFSYHLANALIENPSKKILTHEVEFLIQPNPNKNTFISDTFRGLYFTDEENEFLDNVRANIELMNCNYKKSLALAALSRACLKKRPRGIFTYTGNRYDDGRADLKISLRQHFIDNINSFNNAVFDNGVENKAFNCDVFDLDIEADLVYLDPPYYTKASDNDYTRRYHFVEGLVREWKGLEILQNTTTKKFKRYDTPFLHREEIEDAFRRMLAKFSKSIIVISYSSNSLPDKASIFDMLKEIKGTVRVHEVEHLYSFGNHGNKVGQNANRVQEYIFVAY
jgi:DNA adenine methylase